MVVPGKARYCDNDDDNDNDNDNDNVTDNVTDNVNVNVNVNVNDDDDDNDNDNDSDNDHNYNDPPHREAAVERLAVRRCALAQPQRLAGRLLVRRRAELLHHRLRDVRQRRLGEIGGRVDAVARGAAGQHVVVERRDVDSRVSGEDGVELGGVGAAPDVGTEHQRQRRRVHIPRRRCA